MRTIRSCIASASDINQCLELPPAVFQHLVKVLRLGEGASLEVFNGRGQRFAGTLTEVGKKSACVLLREALTAMPESPLQSHMGLVMSKGDRFDFALQKATELGVSTITPLTSERCDLKLNSERASKKMLHWQGVITAACEQCQRDTIPTLHAIASLSDWVAKQHSELKLVFHTSASEPAWPATAPQAVSFLIGPEGGLSPLEVQAAQTQDFTCWQLGPRILRTETAPIAILSLLQARWGDF